MVKNIAHRGFSSKYPENTMLAFEKALQAGCDGIELDAHISKDGELVIIHDENIARTTNGKGLVKDYTIQELKQFDASAEFVGVYGFNPIPTLNEYFSYIKDKNIITNIELKNGIILYDGIEKQIIDMADKYNLLDKIILSSFNHYSLLKCKKINPKVKCGFLVGCWMHNVGNYTKSHSVEYIHPRYQNLTDKVLSEIKNNNIGINTWTVNSVDVMKDIIAKDVNGIITNRPDLLNNLLKNK